jgi:hypothetical protein
MPTDAEIRAQLAGQIEAEGRSGRERPPCAGRLRVESSGNRTRVFDVRTGEELTSRCVRVEFVVDAKKDPFAPTLLVTLFDISPEISIEADGG